MVFLRNFAGLLLIPACLVACGPQPRLAEDEAAETGAVVSPDEADPVVARVDGTVIRRSDVEREAALQSGVEGELAPRPGEAEFERILDELIDQRLLALEARRRGLNQSEEARRRLALAEERILSNVLVETAVADAVTEETVRSIYEEQIRLIPLGEEVRARHILVDTREEADAIAQLLAEGRDFAELAVAMSQDQATRLEGGDLGYFSRGGILPAFGAVAFATPEGQVSEPFHTEFGWHLLKVIDRRRQPPPSLEALRPNIVRFYTFDQLEALIEGLRSDAEIERPDLAPQPAGGDVVAIDPPAPDGTDADPDGADPLPEEDDTGGEPG